jgi:hypothetical protein
MRTRVIGMGERKVPMLTRDRKARRETRHHGRVGLRDDIRVAWLAYLPVVRVLFVGIPAVLIVLAVAGVIPGLVAGVFAASFLGSFARNVLKYRRARST